MCVLSAQNFVCVLRDLSNIKLYVEAIVHETIECRVFAMKSTNIESCACFVKSTLTKSNSKLVSSCT